MDLEPSETTIRVLVLAETALFVAVGALIVATFLGRDTIFTSVGPLGRGAALAFVVANALAPLWVYYDVRRADDSLVWPYLALLPAVNLFGLLAYLDRRRRRDDAAESSDR